MSQQKLRPVDTQPVPVARTRRLGPRHWAYHAPVYGRSTLGTLLRRLLFLVIILGALGLLVTIALKLWVNWQTSNLIFDTDVSTPPNHVGIVFGAGLNAQGGPSAMLYDRIATAAELYHNGRINKLLMTGDNSQASYNEVEAMRKAAIQLGVADEDIVLDYAGFNTWDSCYRAREVFSLNEVTLITQRFHLPRALFTCNQLGVEAIGVAADRQDYPTSGNELREYPALLTTLFRMLINDQPRFLGPKINIDEPQR